MGQSESTPSAATKPVNVVNKIPSPPSVESALSESLLRQHIETLADVSPNLSPKSLTDVMQTAAQLAGCTLSIDADGLRAELASAAAGGDASSSVSEHPQLPVQLSVALWEKMTQSGVCHCVTKSHATNADPNDSSTTLTADQTDLLTTRTPRNISLATTSLVEHIQKNLFESEHNPKKAVEGDVMVVDLVLRKTSFEEDIASTSKPPEVILDTVTDSQKPPSVKSFEIAVLNKSKSNQPEVIVEDAAPPSAEIAETVLDKAAQTKAIIDGPDTGIEQTKYLEIPLSASTSEIVLDESQPAETTNGDADVVVDQTDGEEIRFFSSIVFI